jgi:hypothetical protein
LNIDPANGRALNASFVDYKMPLAMDMPPIRPIIAIGPAIANALHNALGIRFRRLPITPEKVLQALREQRQVADDTIIIDRMTCNVLDSPSEDGLCSKLLNDATRPVEGWDAERCRSGSPRGDPGEAGFADGGCA